MSPIQSFRFPQTWRTNIGVDRRLPWGLVGTVDYIYNRDVNAPVYINANLPAAESAYTGVDNRPRWVATAAFPACAATGQVGPCVTRLNNAVGNSVTAALRHQEPEPEPLVEHRRLASSKPMTHGFSFRGGYNYGVSKSLVEPSSTAGSSWGSANPIVVRSEQPARWRTRSTRPASACSSQASYSHQYFSFGATTVSAFYDAHPNIVNGFFDRTPATSSRATRTATRSAATT